MPVASERRRIVNRTRGQMRAGTTLHPPTAGAVASCRSLRTTSSKRYVKEYGKDGVVHRSHYLVTVLPAGWRTRMQYHLAILSAAPALALTIDSSI